MGNQNSNQLASRFLITLTIDSNPVDERAVECGPNIFENANKIYNKIVVPVENAYKRLKNDNPNSDIGMVIESKAPFIEDDRRTAEIVMAVTRISPRDKMEFDTIEVRVPAEGLDSMMSRIQTLLDNNSERISAKRLLPPIHCTLVVFTSQQNKGDSMEGVEYGGPKSSMIAFPFMALFNKNRLNGFKTDISGILSKLEGYTGSEELFVHIKLVSRTSDANMRDICEETLKEVIPTLFPKEITLSNFYY